MTNKENKSWITSNIFKDKPEKDKLKCASLIVSALVRMHNKGIVHGRLNPLSFIFDEDTLSNCIISGFDKPPDFQSDISYDKDAGFMELMYASPEKLIGDSLHADLRSDLYSAGAVLYEIFTGERPFNQSNIDELIHAHIAILPVEPSILDITIPETLSDILMKLLAKDPDDRYNNAEEVLNELEFLINQYESGMAYSDIKAAKPALKISEKFYGRSSELDQIHKSYIKVKKGSTKMILISGQAGVGKTAIVNRLYETIGADGCIFGSGKFNTRNSDIPYSAITEAFTMMVRNILSYNETEFDKIRLKFIESLEPNSAIITSLIPDFEMITGPPQPLGSTGPVESKNRFLIWFSRFVSVFTESGLPVVLFLDDLQWADSASLELVKYLMLDSDITGLLVIGAYREGEEYVKGYLGAFIDEAAGVYDTFEQIRLGGVDEASVIEMVKDSLEFSGCGYSDLGKRVFRKTGGNPYFTKEYLKDAYSQGLIAESSGIWTWDSEKLETLQVSDGLASILSQSMKSLNENLQRVLAAGACAGWYFDEGLIAAVLRMEGGNVKSLLEELCSAGYTLIDRNGYRFIHDKLRETAYDLIPEKNRHILHWRTGRVLYGMASSDDELFQAVEQMNLGRDLINSDKERVELAQLNLNAGKKAKREAAFSSALKYLSTAYEMLPENSWEDEYDLTCSVYRELAEVQYVEGNYNHSDELIDTAVNNSITDYEKAEFYYIRILQYYIMARHPDGINVGKKALSFLNIFIPEHNIENFINVENENINNYVLEYGINSALQLPVATDKSIILAVKILNKIAVSAFFCDFNILTYSVFYAAVLTINHGISIESSSVFSGLGNLYVMKEDFSIGYSFILIALNLTEKFNDPANKCVVCNMAANNISFWFKHIRESRVLNELGYKSGLESGELIYTGMITSHMVINSFHSGTNLNDILLSITGFITFNVRTRNIMSLDILYGLKRILLNLTGITSEILNFDMDYINEETYINTTIEHANEIMLTQYYIFKVQTLYLYKEYNMICNLFDMIVENIQTMMCVYTGPEFNFYHSLSLISLIPSSDEIKKNEYLDTINANQKKMKIWSSQCKENFKHKYLLVEAELASLKGDVTSAIDLYDAAIRSAGENFFIQNEALGNELAGRFWLRQGREDYAMVHLKRAFSGYENWGAVRKVELMEAEFPGLVNPGSREDVQTAGITENPIGVALVKSLQAISSEIEFEKLMHTLMRNMLQYEGGTRIVLFIEKDKQLYMEAEGFVEQENGVIRSVLFHSLPVDECSDIPVHLIRYCARVDGPLIFNDVVTDQIPPDDVYFKDGRAKSVLCVKSRSGTTGVLSYIENSLTKNAFTSDRVEVLKLLAVQAAISAENSRLYMEKEESARRLTEMGEAREKLLHQYEEARHKAMIERTNPHFLYNAIHTIHALIKMDPGEADRGTLMLAEIMRFLTDRSFEQLVSIEDEMRFVELYLSFEKIRFPETLNYSVKIEGYLNDVMIPPLTIQPLVENAIKHGLRKKTEAGMIDVSGSINSGIVTIEVCDTGPGIFSDDLYSRTLGNIRDRLRYNFRDADVTLKNGKNRGAAASVSFRFNGE